MRTIAIGLSVSSALLGGCAPNLADFSILDDAGDCVDAAGASAECPAGLDALKVHVLRVDGADSATFDVDLETDRPLMEALAGSSLLGASLDVRVDDVAGRATVEDDWPGFGLEVRWESRSEGPWDVSVLPTMGTLAGPPGAAPGISASADSNHIRFRLSAQVIAESTGARHPVSGLIGARVFRSAGDSFVADDVRFARFSE
jgi:hypothetical protein